MRALNTTLPHFNLLIKSFWAKEHSRCSVKNSFDNEHTLHKVMLIRLGVSNPTVIFFSHYHKQLKESTGYTKKHEDPLLVLVDPRCVLRYHT